MSEGAPRRSRPRKAETPALIDELRRKLGAPKETAAAAFSDARAHAYIGLKARKRSEDLAPHRLAWIGAVLRSPSRSPTPYIEALVAPLEGGEPAPMRIKALPIRTLTTLNVARRWTWKKRLRRKPKRLPAPPSKIRAAPKEWTLYAWFGSPDTCVASVDDVPVLAIATPPEEQSLTGSAFCVVLDRSTRRVAIVPCWEIFRYYYAWSEQVAAAVFQFPRWKPGTTAELLARFDGHRFRRRRVSRRWERDDAAYATAQLHAIGREASVSYVRSGRAEIRALPPFVGPVRIGCAGIPLRFGRFNGLLVRRILRSLPRCDADRSLRWW